MKRLFKSGVVLALLLSLIFPIRALDNGAYLSGRSTTYASPFTGSTADGGENVTLGDSMISSMVENTMLIEVNNGHIYATIGIGLQSNISNVRFNLMNNDGSSYGVSATVTGSSYNNGDSVNHYRIELQSLSQWISPIIYVAPMGRDVQFFVQSNQSLTPGTGIYTSQMVLQTSNESSASSSTTNSINDLTTNTNQAENTSEQENQEINQDTNQKETKEEKVEMVAHPKTKEELFNGVTGLSYHEVEMTTSSNATVFFVVGGVCLLLFVGGVVYAKKKNKK